MPGDPIDYSALAKKAGAVSSQPAPAGAVDYAALAKQAGAVSSQPVVSPGATDDDIIRSFGYDPEVIKSSARYQEAVKAHGSGLAHVLTDPNRKDLVARIADSKAGDVGEGGVDVVKGLVQLARHGANKLGLLSDADAMYGDLLDRVTNQDYLQNIRHGNASPAMRMLGNALFPVPGVGKLIKGEGTVAAIGRGALEGATAAEMQPVLEGRPDAYWEGKGEQAIVGAGTGAAIGGAVAGGTKVVNAIRGKMPAKAAEVLEQGKQHGVDLTYGDVSGSPAVQKAEVAMESVPVAGTSKFRGKQQQQAKAAAEQLKEKYSDKLIDTEPEAYMDVLEAAKNGDQRAKNLVEKLHNAGNDPDQTLQASIGLADFRTRQNATGLYDEVQQLVESNKLGDVPLSNTQKALSASLSELRSAKLKNKEVQALLEEVQGSISPKKASAPANPFPEGTANWREFEAKHAGATVPAKNDYGAMRGLLSDLGDRIRSFYDGNNAIIGEKGVQYLERVRNAIEGDMQDFVQKSGVPELQEAGKVADEYYRTARVPFKDGMLARAANSNEPDQIFQEFIKAGKGDRAQNFYNALDNRGQAAVRYQMVAKAVNDATDPAKGTFSPQKFFTSMDKLKDAYGVFFKGADQWEMNGFKNLMAHVTRAGQFAEDPPTGNRAVHLLVGGGAVTGAFANPALTAEVLGTVAAAKTLFTTDAGKKLLLAAATVKPGTQKAQALLDQVGARMATSASSERTVDIRPLVEQYRSSGMKAGKYTPTDEEIEAAAHQVLNGKK